MEQVGSNVVATGSGAFNLTGLTFITSVDDNNPGIAAQLGLIDTGPFATSNDVPLPQGFTGPTRFRERGPLLAQHCQRRLCRNFRAFSLQLFVPLNYVSGAALADSMTFNNATFASLGATPGTYVWTWGTGLPNQNFTLIIGGAGVPDAGSTVSFLGFALLGLAVLRRKLRC